MAIIVEQIINPSAFLDKIYKAIDNNEIDTWKYDKDKDFTHFVPQWNGTMWLRPSIDIKNSRATFTTLPLINKVINAQLYGLYHGRFIEMLLTHFDKDFDKVYATALAKAGEDIVDGR